MEKTGFEGKNVVVTGASRGVGRAVAEAFVAAGANVVTGSRSASDVPGAVHIETDLTSAGGAAQLIDRALELGEGLDVLVNNVGGTMARLEGFLEIDEATWEQTLQLNLMAAVRSCRAALPSLLDGGGTIVNVSSVNAYEPTPMAVDYSAAKAALANFSKCLSLEYAARGVRVNTVTLGPVDTPALSGSDGVMEQLSVATGKSVEELMAGMVAEREMPLGRFGQPHEVAAVILFLASPAASLVTGADWLVDGGFMKAL